ncbi:YHYH domain-containing protein [Fredinandcohnia humi]
MKNVLSIFFSTFIVFTLLFSNGVNVSAHPGRTDSSGGHTCRTNCPSWGLDWGEYHYHDGRSSGSSGGNSGGSTYIDPYQEAEKLVRLAESFGGSLKWEISLEYRKSKYPKNPLSQLNMKLYNNTKVSLNKAKNAAEDLSDYWMLDRLVIVEEYLLRAQAYIDAVTAGEKLLKKVEEYKKLYAVSPEGEQTKSALFQMEAEWRKLNIMVYRVYGKTTREALLQKYNINNVIN